MKIKKVLASILLAVTLFNISPFVYSVESFNSQEIKQGNKSNVKLKEEEISPQELLNKLELENKISPKENQKFQQKIKEHDIKLKSKMKGNLIKANCIIFILFGKLLGFLSGDNKSFLIAGVLISLFIGRLKAKILIK